MHGHTGAGLTMGREAARATCASYLCLASTHTEPNFAFGLRASGTSEATCYNVGPHQGVTRFVTRWRSSSGPR